MNNPREFISLKHSWASNGSFFYLCAFYNNNNNNKSPLILIISKKNTFTREFVFQQWREHNKETITSPRSHPSSHQSTPIVKCLRPRNIKKKQTTYVWKIFPTDSFCRLDSYQLNIYAFYFLFYHYTKYEEKKRSCFVLNYAPAPYFYFLWN